MSKFNIEKHLKQVVANTQKPVSGTESVIDSTAMQYTILRPVAFMDNLTPDFFGRVFATILKLNGRKMQLIDTESVGVIAANAFLNPERYLNQSFSLASDSVSFEDVNESFKRKFNGREVPRTYEFVARLVMLAAWKELGIMFKWIREEGFEADVTEFRSLAEVQNFEQWLGNSSKFKQ